MRENASIPNSYHIASSNNIKSTLKKHAYPEQQRERGIDDINETYLWKSTNTSKNILNHGKRINYTTSILATQQTHNTHNNNISMMLS